jgi:hypothetical protein
MGHPERPTPEAAALSAAMAECSPVFLTGCNRSGTSVLRATLERHPRFRARGPRSPETRVFAVPKRVFYVQKERGRGLWRYLLEDRDAARALLAQLGRPEDWPPHSEAHWVRLFFHFAWQARGVARGLEKTPRHVLHLDRIFECFPRARVSISIRHPVDVLSSLRKRRIENEEKGRGPRPGGWQHFGPDEMAEAWRTIAGIIDTHARGPHARCHLVRYEDLTADPERALAALCDFIGEPFDRESLLGAVASQRDAGGSPDNRGRIAANPKRWSDWLAEVEAVALEDALADVMPRLGYARYT